VQSFIDVAGDFQDLVSIATLSARLFGTDEARAAMARQLGTAP
jgi:hypothetical protein